MRGGGGVVAVKKLSKKSVARSDSVWRGDPGGDHSCLSKLIEGLDRVTRRGLDSKSSRG